MMVYTEVPVLLRFRSKEPISYAELSYRMQMSSLEGLVEFEILELPQGIIDAAWVRRQQTRDQITDKQAFCA